MRPRCYSYGIRWQRVQRQVQVGERLRELQEDVTSGVVGRVPVRGTKGKEKND